MQKVIRSYLISEAPQQKFSLPEMSEILYVGLIDPQNPFPSTYMWVLEPSTGAMTEYTILCATENYYHDHPKGKYLGHIVTNFTHRFYFHVHSDGQAVS